jgi:Flp pilus assembly protein TadG
MRSLLALIRRFHDDERGVFAVLFGVIAIVLIAAAGAVVDYTSMEQTRTRAQIALDSAVLGLAPTIYSNPTKNDLMQTAFTLIEQRLNDPNVTVDITDALYDKPNGTLRITGRVTVPMAFMQLIGFPSLSANLMAEAKKSSINIEVAVSLDNSGSMKNYIDELQEGVNGLIDIVVSDIQQPTYSKMAIVPWSASVYAGDYASALRGNVPAARAITSIYWAPAPIDITNATKTNPVVVTAPGHGFANGDIVRINGVKGMTQLNDKFYQVASKTTDTFALQATDGTNVNGTGYGTFAANGNTDKVRKCLYWVPASTACQVVVESPAHGFQTGDYIRTNDGASSSTYRNKFYTITRRDANTYTLDGITNATTSSATLSTGGGAWCTTYGCEWYHFQRKGRTDFYDYRITKCVTERATNTYTDAPPSTTLLGPNYHSSSTGACDTSFAHAFTPLTANRNVLLAESAKMADSNTTSGHLGTAWAWYLLAPDWGYLWPNAENVPSAYNADNTMKVAILMTDGVYNQQYCNGVIDSAIESCSAPDTSTAQARALCTKMKEAGIIIYTVGFNIANNSSPAVTMQQCATDSSKYFRPATGAELIANFADIGQDITDLRLSQ